MDSPELLLSMQEQGGGDQDGQPEEQRAADRVQAVRGEHSARYEL